MCLYTPIFMQLRNFDQKKKKEKKNTQKETF